MLPKEKILARMRSNDNKLIIRALQETRNFLKKNTLSNSSWLVDQLLQLLEKTNTNVLDLSLSNLATLLLEQEARATFRANNGVSKLMKIVTNLEDVSILRRGFRAASNAALDPKICYSLHQNGIASTLGHKLQSTNDEQMQIVLLRCIRILSDAPKYRNWLDEEGVYDRLATMLQDPDILDPQKVQEATEATELTKVLLKCVAKLTHGANLVQAGKILPAASVLATLATANVRDVWEHSVMCLVNVSQHSSLRPSLGNVGVVKEFVDKYNSGDLTIRETNQVITALCLYCRESVNRVKLRESGGCSVFVDILQSPTMEAMHDRVINSLLQFMYDNHSLNVFMSVGLIPSLIAFVEQHLKDVKEKKVEEKEDKDGKCDEEECAKNDDDAKETQDKEKLEDSSSSNDEKLTTEEESDSTKSQEEKGTGEASTSEQEKSGTGSGGAGPVFRINSPSYQAVQYELEQFMQLREIHHASERSPRARRISGGGGHSPTVAGRSLSPSGFGYHSPGGLSPSRSEFSPIPPPSLLQSPDRSPDRLSCGYSPQRSEPSPSRSSCNMSPVLSDREVSPDRVCHYSGGGASSPEPSPPPTPGSSAPLYSPVLPSYSPSISIDSALSPTPRDPSYSPIETFSDEDTEDEKEAKSDAAVKKGADAKEDNASAPVGSEKDKKRLREEEEKPSCSKSSKSNEKSKSEEGQTCLSETTVLPEAKRPKLNLTTPVYKYSASPVNSPQIRKSLVLPNIASNEKSASTSDATEDSKALKSAGGRIDWILDVLSRLTQADRPHEDLTSARTVHCLFELCCTDEDSYPRIMKILTRLSKNLYCLFPFLTQRHPTWFVRKMEEIWSKDGGEKEKGEHYSLVRSGMAQVQSNLTNLAETGYGEGEICHRLVNPTFSQEVKTSIAISSAQLVKERRKLANILVNHESLDLLIDLLEQSTDSNVISDTVLCLSTVSAHVGIVSPNLTLPPATIGPCEREKDAPESYDLILELDDGSTICTSRQLLTTASSVFAAMLEGGFREASRSNVRISGVSAAPLECLVHHLTGCQWCALFARLEALELLELLELSDRYLLPELNIRISHEIVRGCMLIEDFLLQVYEKSLQKQYPVQCSDASLAECTISTVLVADMTVEARTRLVNSLVKSNLSSDFLDDVNKMIRKKIFTK